MKVIINNKTYEIEIAPDCIWTNDGYIDGINIIVADDVPDHIIDTIEACFHEANITSGKLDEDGLEIEFTDKPIKWNYQIIMQIKIKIDNIPGYYTIENNELLYCNDNETIQVSDLTELTVYQYNQLSMSIDAAYPEYELKGRFI